MIGKLKSLNECEENDWWTNHDRTWVFNARTRKLFRIPNFQFPGRKELEERELISRFFKDHNWVGIAYVKDDIGQIQGFKFMYKGPEKLKDTYEKGDYFRAEVLGFEYDLVFERDFWHDLDEKTSEYGLEFKILW